MRIKCDVCGKTMRFNKLDYWPDHFQPWKFMMECKCGFTKAVEPSKRNIKKLNKIYKRPTGCDRCFYQQDGKGTLYPKEMVCCHRPSMERMRAITEYYRCKKIKECEYFWKR